MSPKDNRKDLCSEMFTFMSLFYHLSFIIVILHYLTAVAKNSDFPVTHKSAGISRVRVYILIALSYFPHNGAYPVTCTVHFVLQEIKILTKRALGSARRKDK